MSAPTVLPTAGFTILENDVLLNPSVSIEAKATLTLLKYFDRGTGRGCFARKETLCRFLSISPYRLRRALAELHDLGLITITRRGQGHPDVIRVVQRERQQGPQPLQVEVEEVDEGIDQIDGVEKEWQEELDQVTEELAQVAEKLQEEPIQVAEERLEVAPDALADPPEPQEKTADSGSHDDEIQKSNFLTQEHYIEENENKNINFNTPCTIPSSTEPQNQAPTPKQCDDIISHFYEIKENRQPTRNEIVNWTPTARRLLDEFTLEELKPAVENAVAQGARLFYFVALTAPSFIIERRQQQTAQLYREREAERGREHEEERERRLETIKACRGVYAAQTKDLLDRLSLEMRPQIFRSFFGEVYISTITEESVTLVAPSETIANWIANRYMSLLNEVAGRRVEVVSG